MGQSLNVLYKLQAPDADADHKELVERGLIERTQRNGKEWWHVRFNQVDGPSPIFERYTKLNTQVGAIAKQVFRWVKEEGVRPRDICILSNDKRHGERIADETSELLKQIGAQAVFQVGRAFDSDERTVTVTTTKSFKGYDAEVVVIGGVERFIGAKKILANDLYVAMTRARSILAIFAYDSTAASSQAAEILSVIESCLDGVLDRPKVEKEISNLDDYEDVLARIGSEHRDWLTGLWKSRWIEQEPIVTVEGEILAEPIFWFKEDDLVIACFGEGSPGPHTLHKLEDAGIQVVRPGQKPGRAPQAPSGPASGVIVPTTLARTPVKRQAPSTTNTAKPGDPAPRYSPAYTPGYWCVTRYAASGKAMSDRRVFRTKEAAEQFAATMRNASIKPTIEQLT
jgi:hypothetical protein